MYLERDWQEFGAKFPQSLEIMQVNVDGGTPRAQSDE